MRPGKFNGQNFRRWQKQMRYWLTVLGLISALGENQSGEETSSWLTQEQKEYHCLNRILSALFDHLYDMYQSTTKMAKELWNTLEVEYGIDDVGIKRFAISNFNSYKMVDNKSVGDQIHEYQELLRQVEKDGTIFNENFKVSNLIDKLPPSWDNFARTLRHKKEEFTMTQTINSLRVEDKHKASTNSQNERPPKVNQVENSHNNYRNNNNYKNKFRPRGTDFKNNRFNKRFNNDPNNNNQNNQKKNSNKPKGLEKEERLCYVCGRTNHLAKDCYFKKTAPYAPRNNPNQRGQISTKFSFLIF